uniref:Copia protein n=1 Tax=Cajanus cajan TaxID=3821 RepID=A0A151R0B9_CAJCA|nr:Copia protein [Cajanus cajan]
MDSETLDTTLAPPLFDGDNYHIWAARMEAHLEANDLWKAIEEDYDVPLLPTNPTMAQIKHHKERKARKSKARTTLFVVVSQDIFTRIMTIKSTFQIWNFLKDEYEEDERIKGMQALNLVREVEMYVKHKGHNLLIVSLYVDDLLVTGDDVRLVEEFKQEIMQAFEMKDLGLMTYFLGIEIKQSENEVLICNPMCHWKTKHFNIKLYFLREMQKSGEANLVYYKSEDQLADIFTKPLLISKFELLRKRIGVYSS